MRHCVLSFLNPDGRGSLGLALLSPLLIPLGSGPMWHFSLHPYVCCCWSNRPLWCYRSYLGPWILEPGRPSACFHHLCTSPECWPSPMCLLWRLSASAVESQPSPSLFPTAWTTASSSCESPTFASRFSKRRRARRGSGGLSSPPVMLLCYRWSLLGYCPDYF